MHKLSFNISAKLDRLKPEDVIEQEFIPEVEGTPWDFSQFAQLPPGNDKDDLLKWIASAEKELAKPEPPPESAAIEKRIAQLEVS